LIKAAFVNGADDLYGGHDANGNLLGHIPDSKQGWGRLDMERVLDYGTSILYYDQEHIFDASGETWTRTFSVADPAKPFKVTLVWTDEPGPGLGGTSPAWINDLDLLVTQGGTTWLGNVFTDGWSVPGGSADYKNNVENVYLPAPNGAYQVTVVAANIPGDGVPFSGDDTDQDFALVCWNCLAGADFTLGAEPNDFAVCTPEAVSSTITVGQVLTYTEPVALAVLGVPAGTTAELTPTLVTPPGQAALTLTVGSATPDGDYTLVVSGTAEVTNVHTVALGLRVSSAPPDAPILLSPVNGATGQPYEGLVFTWGLLPQVDDYSLQVDTSPSFAAPVLDVSGIPTGTYTPAAPLDPATCYFWRAMGENACGPGGWAAPFHFATVQVDQVFMDDMESGPGNWTATGLWHISTAPTDPCAEAHSGSSSWYYGQEPACNYDAGTNSGRLTMAQPVDLSGALAPATLRFWSWEQTENYSGYDTRKVYLSANGSTWTEVWDSSNNASAWYQVELDVSAYVGGSLYVRFEFDSVDDWYNNYRGWYVDDVEVLAGLPPTDPPQVLGIDPDSGTPYSSTPVTITGVSFMPTPVVLLDNTLLLSVTYVSSTTLTAVVPAGLAPGVYDLTVINGDCQDDTLPAAFTVESCPPLSVSLASDSPVELGRPMHLTATVTGTAPFTYTWDFGGPGSGSGLDTPTPAYTYTAAGDYTVTVTVESTCTSAMASTPIQVLCWPPAGGFGSSSPVELGQAMLFTATVTGTAPFTYTWDFGGPGSGSGLDTATPAYTYTAAGAYTVTLRVQNACGSLVATGTVNVLCFPPAGGFGSSSPVELGQAMLFTATVTGTAPFTYTWDFGGPGSGSGLDTATPAYTYTAPGAYTVTLGVQNACSSLVATGTVNALCFPPAGGFQSDSPVVLGQAMHFTAMVSGTPPLTYLWDFGDGVGYSDQPDPAYTYLDSGEYTVTLTVGGPCGAVVFTGLVMVTPMHYEFYLPLVLRVAGP
jgi:PKD repeat protein